MTISYKNPAVEISISICHVLLRGGSMYKSDKFCELTILDAGMSSKRLDSISVSKIGSTQASIPYKTELNNMNGLYQ